jgi:hypothetical protein
MNFVKVQFSRGSRFITDSTYIYNKLSETNSYCLACRAAGKWYIYDSPFPRDCSLGLYEVSFTKEDDEVLQQLIEKNFEYLI